MSEDPKPTELPLDARLGSYPTAAISDALDELDIHGALSGVWAQRIGQGRTYGRALPVKFVAKTDDPTAYRFGGGIGRPLEQVLQTMKAGDVVIMDLGGTRSASAWGGLASRLAQRRGVRGTVLWGTCRDVEEIRAIGYPVWAVGVCPRRSRNEFTFGSINTEVEIDGVAIAPGDYIVADETGVVCVPQGLAERVLELLVRIDAQERMLEEQVMGDSVRSWDDV